jgi:hypothetical protein
MNGKINHTAAAIYTTHLTCIIFVIILTAKERKIPNFNPQYKEFNNQSSSSTSISHNSNQKTSLQLNHRDFTALKSTKNHQILKFSTIPNA